MGLGGAQRNIEHLRRLVGRPSGSECERRNSSLQERRMKDIDRLRQHPYSQKKRNAGRTMLEFVNTIWSKAMGAMGSVEFISSSSDPLTREC